jgi:hypothetical protein
MSYSVVIPCRALVNETSIYAETFRSLLNQTVKPRNIFVCMNFGKSVYSVLPEIKQLNLSKEQSGGEISPMDGIPKINLGIFNCYRDEHIVISGDDCYYPPNYFETLLDAVERDYGIGIISGLKQENGRTEYERMVVPSGSGRLYNKEICAEIFPHPNANYGESLFLFQSEMLGFHNVVCKETYFTHLRKTQKYSQRSNGLCSYQLGYPFYYSLGRVGVWLLTEHELKYNVLLGHLGGIVQRKEKADKEIRDYVKKSIGEKRNAVLKQLLRVPN